MFCKCFFACLWEELDGDREKLPLKPKLKLSAIYLPAQGYLVESSEGYFQSCWARFQQARRHSQGVAELGYVLLQYIKLLLSAGPFRLSLSAHYKICAIMGKMFTVHIVNSVQAFALIVAGITTLPLLVVGLQEVLGNVFKGNDFSAIVAGFVNGVDSNAAFTAAKWSLLLAFGPLPPVCMLSGYTNYLAVRDYVEGRYWKPPVSSKPLPPLPTGEAASSTESKDENSAKANDKQELTTFQCLSLMLSLQYDMMFLAEPTVIMYGMVPAILACWSLLGRGSKFEYIVAAKGKPGDGHHS